MVKDRVITITVKEDGHKHIETNDIPLVEAMLILDTCVKYLYKETVKDIGLNGVKEGTADTPSGDNSQGEV